MDKSKRDDLALEPYIRDYMDNVLGLKGWHLIDNPLPAFHHKQRPPRIDLPLSMVNLATFLGPEFVLDAPAELLVSIVIGLCLHEVAHGTSGEDHEAQPSILNNMICDSNDFNVVPEKFPGSIPFTLSLTNTWYRQASDASLIGKMNTPKKRLRLLLGLSITYLRKLRVRVDGNDARELPAGHPMRDAFEKIKPIMREARRAPVGKRPELVRALHEAVRDYWVEEQKRAGCKDMAAAEAELEEALSGMRMFDLLPGGLNADDAKALSSEEGLQEAIQKASDLIQKVNQQQSGKSNVRRTDGLVDLTGVTGKPAHVDQALAASVWRAIEPVLFQRTLARRGGSVIGSRFNPARFYEIMTRPEEPRIKKDIVNFVGRRIDEGVVALCFDRSGSMAGDKERVCRQVAATLFYGLALIPRLRIAILSFNEFVFLIKSAIPESIQKVLGRINYGLKADGGTNFPCAFEQAVRLTRETRSHRKLIVMLTDGDLGDEAMIAKTLTDAKQAGIDVVCLGVEGSDIREIQRIFGSNGLYVPDVRRLPSELRKVVVERTAG